MNKTEKSANLISIAFARLSVFDIKKNLWGYELIYMPANGVKTTDSKQEEVITADLVSDTFITLEKIMDKKKKLMVNFSRQNLLDNLPYALPPGRTVVKLTDPANLPDSLIQVLEKLKESGYQIAITWTKDHNSCKAVFKLADIICLDISDMGLPNLMSIYRAAAPYDSQILANSVDDKTKFDICYKAGFSFFQGSFFKLPEDVSVKKVLSGTISRFQLMEAIEQKDPDFSKLAATIQADVAISFRLLSYLNSASFGFRQKIVSIKDAITMLGWQNLKNWLRVVLLTEVSQNRNASELIFLSAQRGKFLEQVGLDHDFWGVEPDSLFLLGIFSLLDALLNQPMNEITKYLPLADKLKDALCMEDNNEYVPLLKLSIYFEEARFDHSNNLTSQLGLDSVKVRQAYRGSIEWANQLSEMQQS